MLTPIFRITQDDRTVTMIITAPFSNLNDLDTSVDAENFIFQCTPYYLRLKLPGKIVENSKTKVSYDESSGEFTLTYEKEENVDFPGLDGIENLTKVEFDDIDDTEIKVGEFPKKLDEDVDNSVRYGFALRGGYKFQNLAHDFGDLFKIDPFEVKFEERNALRLKMETDDFNDEHYAADFMDDAEIQEIIMQENPWCVLNKDEVNFNKIELDFIENLVKFDYVLSEKEVTYAKNSLLEILFAFCYDARTTFFEATCESHWTIRTLSASLSCFDSFETSKEALVCGYRRSLIYPLYRSFKLNETILKDLKTLLNLGVKFIVKSLIEIHNIFLDDDSNSYVLNSLFVKDYIRYVMSWDEEFFRGIIDDFSNIKIEKDDLGLNLAELEKELLEESLENSEEETDVNCLSKQMNKVVISNNLSDKDSSSDSNSCLSTESSSDSE